MCTNRKLFKLIQRPIYSHRTDISDKCFSSYVQYNIGKVQGKNWDRSTKISKSHSCIQTEGEDATVDVLHLEVFEYSSSNLQAPVNILRFILCYAINQGNMRVRNL